MKKKLICADEVHAFVKSGQKVIYAGSETIITPAARDAAKTLGVQFSAETPAVERNVCMENDSCKSNAAQLNNCGCEIDSDTIYKVLKAMMGSGLLKGILDPVPEKPYAAECDPSGIKVVRGKTVNYDYFDTGNPSNKVYYQELIHKEECSMSAGFLTIEDSSFDWELFYDEIDYIQEGSVNVTINGRTITANPGDVLLVPKGSKVVWSAKGFMKLFYVTYPANWPDLMPQQ